MMDLLVSGLIVFAAMAVTDIGWAHYVTATRDSSALRAAGWSVFLFLAGSITTIGYTQHHWLLLPAALGAFAGTWIGVVLANRPPREW